MFLVSIIVFGILYNVRLILMKSSVIAKRCSVSNVAFQSAVTEDSARNVVGFDATRSSMHRLLAEPFLVVHCQ